MVTGGVTEEAARSLSKAEETEVGAQARVSVSRAAITKYHKLGDLKNRHWFSHSSRGWKSQIKVAGRVGSF